MAFPDSPLDVRAELQLNGVYTDVSAYLDHGPISIGRGHPDESTTVSPSTLAATFTNTDARFTDGNPGSPYYPYLLPNVACRVSIPSDQPYLRMETDASSAASCPNTGGLSATGDLDVRIDLQLTDWQARTLLGTLQPSWQLEILGGYLAMVWNTGSATVTAQSTVRVPRAPWRLALRATLALASGTVTFYTGPSGGAGGSTWTQLGVAVVAGATTLQANTGGLFAGGFYGRCYEAQASIAGTVVAHPVFSSQSAGTTSFADAQSNTWTLGGTSELSARDYRMHAEVPEWPQHQPPVDPGGTQPRNVTVAAKGGGLLRRLSQRNNSVRSAMWRAWVKTGVDLAAYIPMEDGAGAQSLASGIGGPAAAFSGILQLASNSDFVSSAPLPVLNGTVISVPVPAYSGTWQGNITSFLMEVPQAGEFNGAEVIRIATAGTTGVMVVTYGTGGSLTLTALDPTGTTVVGTVGPIAFNLNGVQLLVAVSLTVHTGAGLDLGLWTAVPGGTSFSGGTVNISGSIGAVTSVTVDGGGQLLQTVFGHLAVQAAPSLWNVTAFGAALAAHAGETDGARFARICSEEGIQCRIGGDPTTGVLMGVQSIQTLVALLQECADAGRGTWYELRQQLGWGYVPVSGLYNQPAAVAVTYSTDSISEWPSDPLKDDQVIKNDFTLSQTTGGASARQFAAPGQPVTGGRYAALEPPSGVGVYDDSQSYNIWRAADLPGVAAWTIHCGTTDEPRYPGIGLDLSNRALASLFYTILALDLGQRLTVSLPPSHLGPNAVSQLAAQLDEELWGDTLKVAMTGVPSKPYLVAQDGASTAHADTDGSTLAASLGAPLAAYFLPFGSVAGLTSANGTLAASQVPGIVPSGAWWALLTCSSSTNATIQGAAVTATPAEVLECSAVVLYPNGGTVNIGFSWQGAGGSTTTAVTVPAGVITAISSGAITAPGGTTGAIPRVGPVPSSNGLLLYATALVAWQGAVSVATAAGDPIWATSGIFPFDVNVAGERMTVTGISGGSSPQAFTVARCINGPLAVVAQASGAALALWDSPVAAL